MSGVSDVAMRRLSLRYGAGFAVTEMVAASGLVRGDEEARLRSEGVGCQPEGGARPHVVQLVGRDPVRMGEAARLAAGAGAGIIDINFGCPAKSVTGGLGGSALMREPDLATAIMASVARAVEVPVTVKMRLGWDDRDRNAAVLAREAARVGLEAVTVHGRTRQQFYKGDADWHAIAEVAAAVEIPVIVNGDIASLAAAQTALARSGAAAVMIGRAAMGQPWLVGEIAAGLAGVQHRSPDGPERAACAAEHYEALLVLYGTRIGTKHARKHLAAYADRAREAGFGLAEADRIELVTSMIPRRVLGLLCRLYDEPMRLAA